MEIEELKRAVRAGMVRLEWSEGEIRRTMEHLRKTRDKAMDKEQMEIAYNISFSITRLEGALRTMELVRLVLRRKVV